MDYIDRHFVREETMMAEHGYPSIGHLEKPPLCRRFLIH